MAPTNVVLRGGREGQARRQAGSGDADHPASRSTESNPAPPATFDPSWPRPWREGAADGSARVTAQTDDVPEGTRRSRTPQEEDYRRIISPQEPLLEPRGETSSVLSPISLETGVLGQEQEDSEQGIGRVEPSQDEHPRQGGPSTPRTTSEGRTGPSQGLRRSRSIHSRVHLGTSSSSGVGSSSSTAPRQPLLAPWYRNFGREMARQAAECYPPIDPTAFSMQNCLDTVMDAWEGLRVGDPGQDADELREIQRGPPRSDTPFCHLLFRRAAALIRGQFAGVDGEIINLRQVSSLNIEGAAIDPSVISLLTARLPLVLHRIVNGSDNSTRPKRRLSSPGELESKTPTGTRSSSTKRSRRGQRQMYLSYNSPFVSTTGIGNIVTRFYYTDGGHYGLPYRALNALRNDSSTWCSAQGQGHRIRGLYKAVKKENPDRPAFRRRHSVGPRLHFDYEEEADDDEEGYQEISSSSSEEEEEEENGEEEHPHQDIFPKRKVKYDVKSANYTVVTLCVGLLPPGAKVMDERVHHSSTKSILPGEIIRRNPTLATPSAIGDRPLNHLGGISNRHRPDQPGTESHVQPQQGSLESSWVDWASDPTPDLELHAEASASPQVKILHEDSKPDINVTAADSDRPAVSRWSVYRPVTISKIVLKAPPSGYTSPVKRALVFSSLQDPTNDPAYWENVVLNLKSFDYWGRHNNSSKPVDGRTKCLYDRQWSKDYPTLQSIKPHHGDAFGRYGLQFVEALTVDQKDQSVTVDLKTPISARWVVIKLFSDLRVLRVADVDLPPIMRNPEPPSTNLPGNRTASGEHAQTFTELAREVRNLSQARYQARMRARIAEQGQFRPRRIQEQRGGVDELVSDVTSGQDETRPLVRTSNQRSDSSLTARGRALAFREREHAAAVAQSASARVPSSRPSSFNLLEADERLTFNDMMLRGIQARRRRGRGDGTVTSGTVLGSAPNSISNATIQPDLPIIDLTPTLAQTYETRMPGPSDNEEAYVSPEDHAAMNSYPPLYLPEQDLPPILPNPSEPDLEALTPDLLTPEPDPDPEPEPEPEPDPEPDFEHEETPSPGLISPTWASMQYTPTVLPYEGPASSNNVADGPDGEASLRDSRTTSIIEASTSTERPNETRPQPSPDLATGAYVWTPFESLSNAQQGQSETAEASLRTETLDHPADEQPSDSTHPRSTTQAGASSPSTRVDANYALDANGDSVVRLPTMARRPAIDDSFMTTSGDQRQTRFPSRPRHLAYSPFPPGCGEQVDTQYIGFYGYVGARSFGTSTIR